MWIILHDYRFFFEVPSFEELQDPNSSPRREEVGRRTLRDYGGFLLSFFCRDRFRYIQTLWEQKNRVLPRLFLREPLTVPEHLVGHLGGHT